VIQFDTDKKPLTFLLDQIENRVLALPDFQRSFVWDAEATRQLVVSIVSSFPAGSLLLMQGGGDIFAPRAFEEAPDLNGMPAYMVLDGQQRLTSLFQAFMGRGTHRYFVNLQELLDGYELDEAVEVFTTKRARRWESLTGQARDLMLPLWKIRQFAWWRDEVLELLGESELDVKKLKAQFNDLEHAYVKPDPLLQVTRARMTTTIAAAPQETLHGGCRVLGAGLKLAVEYDRLLEALGLQRGP
jgi:hypothetical protein